MLNKNNNKNMEKRVKLHNKKKGTMVIIKTTEMNKIRTINSKRITVKKYKKTMVNRDILMKMEMKFHKRLLTPT